MVFFFYSNLVYYSDLISSLFIMLDNSYALFAKDFSINFQHIPSNAFPRVDYPLASDCSTIKKNANINLNLDLFNALLISHASV